MEKQYYLERRYPFNKPYISILLPTRKRVKHLNETLYSIYSLADHNNINFEIIVKVDFDDIETIEYIKNNWTNECENIYFIISSRKEGYSSMADFQEYMLNLSRGEYSLVINDDLLFVTKNWNNILEKKLTDFKIYFPNVNGYKEAFWCIPKKLYEILGHVAWHNQTDTYLHVLANRLGIRENITEVDVYHRHGIPDEITEARLNSQNMNFNSRDYHYSSTELEKDVKMLQNYIESLSK